MLGPGGVGKTRLARRGRQPPANAAPRPARRAGRAGHGITEHGGRRRRIDARRRRAATARRPRIAWRPSSARARSSCCWTTASTSWSRSPSWSNSCSPVVPASSSWPRRRERLRVAGEQLCPVPPLPILAARRTGRRSCSWNGPAPCDPATRPTPPSGADQRDRAPARRAAAGHRAGRRPAAHDGRRRGRRTGSIAGSGCWLPGAARSARHRSLGAAVEWSYALLEDELQRVFTDRLRRSSARSTWPDAAAVAAVDESTGRRRARRARRSARSWCGRPAAGTRCSRRCGRSGRNDWPPNGRDEVVRRRHATVLDRLGRARPTAGLVRSGTTGLFEIDADLPDLSRRLRLAAGARATASPRRSCWRRCTTSPTCGCAPTCWRGPTG